LIFGPFRVWPSPRAGTAVEAIAGAELTRVPLRLEENLPVVEVSVAGKVLPVLLDLGGFDSLALRPEALAGLGAQFTGKKRRWVDNRGRRFRSREYVLPEVVIGDLRLGNVRGYEDRGEAPAVPGLQGGLQGYLGLGVLARLSLVIDYPGKRLTLARNAALLGKEYPLSDWPSVPFSRDRSGVLTTFRVEGRTLRCIWDTGYQYSVIRWAPPERVKSEGEERHFMAPALDAAGVDLGPLDFVVFDFKQPPVDAMIGFNFFRDRAVLFDFENNRLAAGPAAAGP
jgi:hypothetical protein